MAARKKKKATKVPQSGAEKSARNQLYAAQQLGLSAQQQRTTQQSRGAYSARKLRAGGTDLQRYDLARFKDDPFPGLGVPGGGGGGVSQRGGRPVAPTSPMADGRARAKAQAKAKGKNERRDNINSPNVTERSQENAAAAAAAAAKAAAAKAAAAKKKKAKLTDSAGGNKKALGTKPQAS